MESTGIQAPTVKNNIEKTTEAQEMKNASTKSQPTGDFIGDFIVGSLVGTFWKNQLNHEKKYDIPWNTTGCFIRDPYNGLL